MSRAGMIAELQKLRQDVDHLTKLYLELSGCMVAESRSSYETAQALSARIEALEAKRVGRPKKDE